MDKTIIRKDKNCRLCNSNKINEVFPLKSTPPEDLFFPENKIELTAKTYPLVLAICEDCGYVHLPYIINPKVSYTDYVYETKITVGLSKNYKEYADSIISFAGTEPGSSVIDLGSNDGTMLKAFKESGMKVLGVEPNDNIAGIANRNGLDTIADYFNSTIANRIIKEHGRASVITANYMYANIDNVVAFTGDVKKILEDEGLFVIQTGYHPEQMKINMFDYIYHEHFSYFSVKVLKQLLEQCGMELIHVSLYSPKGGSIRVIAQHRGGKRKQDDSVDAFIKQEEHDGIHEPKSYMRFAEEIDLKKKDVLDLLKDIRALDQRIVGYGASHSTTTLLHHFEMGDYLDYLVDDNPIKHGLYSPGYHLPVYPSKKLYDDKPKYVLVLGWQHQDSIINRNMSFLNEGGKFIVPLPKLKIVND